MRPASTIITCIALLLASAAARAEIVATYMGNEGVLIEYEGSKIVFDPLYRNNFNQYELVPDDMRAALMDGVNMNRAFPGDPKGTLTYGEVVCIWGVSQYRRTSTTSILERGHLFPIESCRGNSGAKAARTHKPLAVQCAYVVQLKCGNAIFPDKVLTEAKALLEELSV